MRPIHLCALIAISIVCGLSCFAQSAEPFLPITPQDLAIKDVPGNPGAAAIRLYYSYYRDDDKKLELTYERIKILNDGGKQYADVEIPLEPKDTLKELKARTIHPDGSIIEFTGKPFEKTVIKDRKTKYLAETFTLPDVAAGSIVEYSYSLAMGTNRLGTITSWPLQGDLYTVRERFRYQPYVGFLGPRSLYAAPAATPPREQAACAYQNRIGTPLFQYGKNGFRELELKDVAPFNAEEFMPPQSDYRASILCYYGGGPLFSYDRFWEEWQKLFAEGIDKYIGHPSSLREAAKRAIGSETDPEKKLRKLYAFAQQIRNISYERERTEKEQKSEKLKFADSADEVLRHGYGNSFEINALFAGLARAAGFPAFMLMINDRYKRSFNRYILWFGQLNGTAVMVDVDGTMMFLDPGTRFCPFGELAPRFSEAKALVMKTGGGFLTTPPPPRWSGRRTVNLSVASDGSAKGQIALELEGPRALEERLEALDTDDAGRRKSLEEEVSAWLPSGAIVKMTESDGWTSSDVPLKAKFSVEMPSFASVTGKRFIVPAYVLTWVKKRFFTSDFRVYPIDFGNPFSEEDKITLDLPEGYALEESPFNRKAHLPWGEYEFSTSVDGNRFVTNRSLQMDKFLFQTSDYTQLKYLFGVVQTGDSSQAVLQAKQTAASDGAAK